MEKGFFIRANVFGKTKYWNFINGLHSGKGRTNGYSMFPSVREANKTIKKLKSLFHDGIKYEILPHDELPFIKKQILARNRNQRVCTYCGICNDAKKKHCRKCGKYQG